ncbi:MAG: right-handed parallel beta-helix repeat-containing protein [Polyangiaceae bacterium]
MGSARCQPIGDCAAAFPPDDAAIFVDAAFTAGELDATHFATIGEALQAAPDGAVIAVEAGTYAEALDIARSVSVVGRCAAEVQIASPGGAQPGIASDADAVVLRGLTVSGHLAGGIQVTGGSARVEQCQIKGNVGFGVAAFGATLTVVESSIADSESDGAYGLGAFALESGRIELVDSVIVRAKQIALGVAKASSASVTRTVIRDTETAEPGGKAARGLQVDTDSTIEVESSALLDNGGAAMAFGGGATTATVRQTVLRGGAGPGILVRDGASLDLFECVVGGFGAWGIFGSAESVTTARRSVVRGAYGTESNATGGVLFETGAVATLEEVAIVDNVGMGLQLQESSTSATLRQSLIQGSRATVGASDGFGVAVGFGSTLVADDVALVANEIAGLVVVGAGTDGKPSAASADRLLVRDTVASPTAGYGRGIDVSETATLTLSRSAVSRSVEIAVGIAYGSVVDIADSTLRGTAPTATGAADGVMVVDATLRMARSTTRDHARIGLVFSGASALLDASAVAGNAVGIHAQDGSVLQDVDALPATPPDLQILVTPSTHFIGNLTRIGSGVVPLPSPLAPLAN